MALFNIADQIKNGLKAELKKNPKVLAGLEKLDTGIQGLAGLVSRLAPGDILIVLGMLNNAIGKKFSDAELAVVAGEIAHLPEALKELDALIQGAEKELKQ